MARNAFSIVARAIQKYVDDEDLHAYHSVGVVFLDDGVSFGFYEDDPDFWSVEFTISHEDLDRAVDPLALIKERGEQADEARFYEEDDG